MTSLVKPKYFEMHYSISRYFVDVFLNESVKKVRKESEILDVGGEKDDKKGQFIVEKYLQKVRYLNIDPKTKPDYLGDAAKMAIKGNKFSGVICSQVLEHVKDPKPVLKEINRILKPNGILLIAVPFLFRIHADPFDYGRYTDQYWKETLKQNGFKIIKLTKFGGYFSVWADMIKDGMKHLSKNKIFTFKPFWWFCVLIAGTVIWILMKFDGKNRNIDDWQSSYTTGFGIVAIKN